VKHSTHGGALEATSPDAAAQSEGWGQVTFAINSILQISAPMLLRIDVEGHDPLFIDFRHGAFVWATNLNELPVDARNVSFETEQAIEGAPPLFRLPGQSLDLLLWVLGNNAFRGSLAPWLRPGERYRLSQWPNLGQHLHEMKQTHMLAVLGNGYFSPSELAAATDAPEADAYNLVNALSLLRLLRVSEHVAPLVLPTPPAAEQKDKGTSLFARLRARLGR
jgi:hypothetical protein